MMDEYERAAGELKRVLAQTSEENFNRIVDTETKDEHCRSIQTIMTHVVGAGYGYADSIRKAISMPSARPKETFRDTLVPVQHREAAAKLDAMLAYTAQTLEGRWEMTDEEIERMTLKTSWGATYHLEQLLEHAIVHILRHRRQVERFLERMAKEGI